MLGWVSLATVLLKIVKHFLDNKTPESKAAYVKNLDGMAKALVERDVDTVNILFDELREATREGDEDGLSPDEITLRKLRSDTGLAGGVLQSKPKPPKAT